MKMDGNGHKVDMKRIKSRQKIQKVDKRTYKWDKKWQKLRSGQKVDRKWTKVDKIIKDLDIIIILIQSE